MILTPGDISVSTRRFSPSRATGICRFVRLESPGIFVASGPALVDVTIVAWYRSGSLVGKGGADVVSSLTADEFEFGPLPFAVLFAVRLHEVFAIKLAIINKLKTAECLSLGL